MQSMELADVKAATPGESSIPLVRWPTIFLFGLFLLLWGGVIMHLRAEWSYNPQYNYGWMVPLFALFFFWRRWPTRPTPAPPRFRASVRVAIVVSAVAILLLQFVGVSNPDWRLLSWSLALGAILVSFCFIYLSGGSTWAEHLTFPILFFLVAVPWPTFFEQSVIQSLMRAVTAINVFGLNLAGIPAVQLGNVIEVSSGYIGIEEACSGVRSLQATLMISLFLGELYMFTASRRILLIVLGAILAFSSNVVRSAILVWVVATQGSSRVAAWHDPAGMSIFIFCLLALWLISLWLRKGVASKMPESHSVAGGLSPSPVFVSLLAGAFLLGQIAIQIWYNSHQSAVTNSRWSVRDPASEAYEKITIPPETQRILASDESSSGKWTSPDGHQWLLYFFRWLPGRTAALFVKIHRPDVCLPASGLTMTRETGIRLREINGVTLPIRTYRFDAHGIPLHVLYCYWDGRSSYDKTEVANEEDWSAEGRVRSALRGRREVGAQMLELVVWGYKSDAEAETALSSQLGEILERG
jgi:exosortase